MSMPQGPPVVARRVRVEDFYLLSQIKSFGKGDGEALFCFFYVYLKFD